jgi:hypothetical protein
VTSLGAGVRSETSRGELGLGSEGAMGAAGVDYRMAQTATPAWPRTPEK